MIIIPTPEIPLYVAETDDEMAEAERLTQIAIRNLPEQLPDDKPISLDQQT